jgi:ATP-dependent RNA helicase DeaD
VAPTQKPSQRASRKRETPRTRRGRGDPNGNFVRIYVALGRRAGVRPADLVGAIANEADIDSREIGAIDIADSFSLVEVPEQSADMIVGALKRTKLRGRPVKARRERL